VKVRGVIQIEKVMQVVNRNPSIAEVRKFGLTMLLGLAVLSGLLLYLTDWAWSEGGPHWLVILLAGLGVMFISVCMASYSWGKSLYVVWMTGATYLGTVMSTILLSVVFFVLLPVFSLIRLKDPLKVKLKETGSYWEDHDSHEAGVDRMMRPF